VKLSKRIATGYEVTAKALGSKAVVTGNPVRAEFFDIAPRKPEKPFRLLITGGSQGALPINRAFVDAMDLLAARKDELSVVHANRRTRLQRGQNRLCSPRVSCRSRSVPRQYVRTLRLGRLNRLSSGSNNRRRSRRAGRAAVFIPFGRATDSHQLRNAQEMVNANAGRLIAEPQLTAGRLASEIFSLLDHSGEVELLGFTGACARKTKRRARYRRPR